MKDYVLLYCTALVVFLALDFVWLKTMGPTFYANELGSLLRDAPDLGIAFAFYLLFVAGLVVFVIQPGMTQTSLAMLAIKGGFFGLVAYATYDLTNLATIKGFTLRVALVDMAWGAILSATVTLATVVLVKRFMTAPVTG